MVCYMMFYWLMQFRFFIQMMHSGMQHSNHNNSAPMSRPKKQLVPQEIPKVCTKSHWQDSENVDNCQ